MYILIRQYILFVMGPCTYMFMYLTFRCTWCDRCYGIWAAWSCTKLGSCTEGSSVIQNSFTTRCVVPLPSYNPITGCPVQSYICGVDYHMHTIIIMDFSVCHVLLHSVLDHMYRVASTMAGRGTWFQTEEGTVGWDIRYVCASHEGISWYIWFQNT